MKTYTLDPALREQLKVRSNWRGAASVAQDYGLMVAAFALPIAWSHPLAWLLSVLMLCGVHVGLAILTHEAAHKTLFANSRVNDWVGQYLCALPNFNHMPMYRTYHMAHHRLAGTPDDPDRIMVDRYPVSKANLRRKLLRDLSGQSGVKFLIGIVAMTAGYWKFQQNGVVEKLAYDRPQRFIDYAGRFLRRGGAVSIAWQLAIWGALHALGHGELYLLWALAFLIPFPLTMRVRVLADHGAIHDPDSTDPLLHARTTRLNWIEKLLFAPHHEHYHLEHHLMPSCPHWNLPKLHARLVADGVIPPANQANGMREVLRRVTR